MSTSQIPVDLILSKLAEEVERSKDRIMKSQDVLLGPLDTEIAATPHEVVYEEDRVKLKHYSPPGGKRVQTPLLIVYALINRETMLDLQPGRSVVQNLINAGIDLYMVDWGYPTRKDRYLTIEDHVLGYMDNMVEFIRRREKVPQVNLMGVCMGGAFSLMYSALFPHKIRNLITTVTPSNFDTDKGLLHIWMKEIDVDRMVDTYGNMPGDLLNIGFLLLNPARLMIDKYVGFLENMDDRKFVENFVRMEKWIFDSPDVPGETFKQFVKDCYQNNLLIQSKMKLGGRKVDLKKITMPLLNIYGHYDHLVPPEACNLLTGRVGSTDTEDICLETGHIGIYVSSKCQKEFSPKIARWLADRDAPQISEQKPAAAPEKEQEAKAERPEGVKTKAQKGRRTKGRTSGEKQHEQRS